MVISITIYTTLTNSINSPFMNISFGKLRQKISDGCLYVLFCCLFPIAFIFGGLFLLGFLCHWLWSIEWVRNAIGVIGDFLVEHSQFIEDLIFVVLPILFLLYLFVVFSFFIYHGIKEFYNYAIVHDFLDELNASL